jgi:hypothetical protein
MVLFRGRGMPRAALRSGGLLSDKQARYRQTDDQETRLHYFFLLFAFCGHFPPVHHFLLRLMAEK